MDSVFHAHFADPHASAVVNTKLMLLSHGLAIDVDSIARDFGSLEGSYKTSRSVVSDRHQSARDIPQEYLVDELILSDGELRSIVKSYISESAPFALISDSGSIRLQDRQTGTFLPVDVDFVELDEFSRPDPSFPDKHLFVNRIGLDRIGLLPFEGCELWLEKKQCHFCGSVPRRRKLAKMPNILEATDEFEGDYRAWWAAHREHTLANVKQAFGILRRHPPSPHFHFMYMSENIKDYDFEHEMALEIAESINEVYPLAAMDSFFNAMPPMHLDLLSGVKDAGYRSYVVNLEFIRRRDFAAFCPGKCEAYPDGYDHMIRALEAAVGVFGPGRVRSNFVLTSDQIPHLEERVDWLSQRVLFLT